MMLQRLALVFAAALVGGPGAEGPGLRLEGPDPRPDRSGSRLEPLRLEAPGLQLQTVQSTGRIDFGRDVQPIFQEHCVSCHGPELQMNGLRLDRRADAMRGGTQSDIGPGNADGSRLYHRLIGTTFGTRMPPKGPLADDQIDIIKRWIDEGADWPDELSGEKPAKPLAPLAARLMEAALYGEADSVKRLLEAGANPNTRNAVGATPLMRAVPDVGKMRLLLDAGADVNARSDDLRSALVIASGIVGAAPALQLLLDYGADPSSWNASETPPLREAARVDDPEMFALLLEYIGSRQRIPDAAYLRTNCHKCAEMVGAGGPLARQPPPLDASATAPRYDPGRAAYPTPIGPTPATKETIRRAVELSLPLLQDVDVAFVQQTGCVSCHHNSLVAMATAAARANGFSVDESIVRKQLKVAGNYLESWRERTLQNFFIAGQADTIAYILFGLAAEHYPSDPAAEAQAIWLKRKQAADGRWPVTTIRPPIESNDIAITALSLRALQVFAPASQRVEYAKAVDRARAWLTLAHAEETEERAFRLLGLSWAGAPRDAIENAARDLLAIQQQDGGWAQTPRRGSDAYATGQALVALSESGTTALARAAYRRGLEYLLSTQIADGSWRVESRAVPIQAYFESGFPYGVHQWISAAGTAWATTALALAK